MFTGIINHVGRVEAASQQGDLRLSIACQFSDFTLGESIACNGACLTVIESAPGRFSAELSAETIACTAPRWAVGDAINLERALKAGDALDGHIVTGHVDGTARLISAEKSGDSHVLAFEAPANLARFVAAKGSVCLNGVSLTVNRVGGTKFWVNIIPHTWDVTNLGTLKAGDSVNLEIDTIARYVARLLEPMP